ncbi:MAG: hypothetical protein LBU38_04155 [Propionibacteriaceae bacterium]|jgi:hypothetical protein|nr:hypothetical protein [Propionibacteriaceae bacterium]
MADRFSRRWWAGLLASLTLVVGLVSGSLVAQTGASAADPAASVQWVKALPKDAANPSEVKSVAVASDGSIYAAGLSGDKAWLVKFGADGSLKWNKTYP